jgi:hypothetical protein
MRARWKVALLVPFAALLPMLMGPTTAGFPSRPTFQQVTVNGTISGTHTGNGAGLTSLNGSQVTTGTVADARLSTNVAKYNDTAPIFTPATAQGFVVNSANLTKLILQPGGVNRLTLCSAGAANQCIPGDSAGDAMITVANGGMLRFSLDGGTSSFMSFGPTSGFSFAGNMSTAGTISAAVGSVIGGSAICTANGTNCPASGPRHSYGHFTAVAGGCSLNTSWQSANISGCARNSTGNYTVTFSVAYTGSPSAPICNASSAAPTVGFTSVNTASAGSTTVQAVNTTFAAADLGSFDLQCVGT